VVEARKEELEKIWKWLRQTITLEEAEWLMKKRPGIFSEEDFPSSAMEARKMIMEGIYNRELVDSNVISLIYTIQDVLDADRRIDSFRCFTKEIPREYLDLLARKVGVDVSKLPRRDALRIILEEL